MRTAGSSFASLLRGIPLYLVTSSLLVTATAAAHAQTPFVKEHADGLPGNNAVGLHASMSLDKFGNPHISHQDLTAGDLKYTRRVGGTWTSEIVDAAGDANGEYTSIALDSDARPHISYRNGTSGVWDLKYAHKAGAAWTIETVDIGNQSTGAYSSIAIDASGIPHICYQDLSFLALRHAWKTGGVWNTEIVDGGEFGNYAGGYCSLAIDGLGYLHVSHQDQTNFNLKYSRKLGNFWTTETVDGGIDVIGTYTSIAVDGVGLPRISYKNETLDDLMYASRALFSWNIETVDPDGAVGSYSSLELDGDGNPHIAYHDEIVGQPKYAVKYYSSWSIEFIDNNPGFLGAYVSLALDAHGNPHVCEANLSIVDLEYLSAAVQFQQPTAGVTWAVGASEDVYWSGKGTVSLLVSADGGVSYRSLVESTRANPISIRVPHLPTRFARMQIVRYSQYSVATSDSFFTIDATITLAKFDATRDAAGGGTRLTWETRPGPESDIRYRVESAGDASAFVTIADGLDSGDFADLSSSAASRYRLFATNGLGEEYALGETRVAGALAAGRDLSIQPNPTHGGRATFTFRAPFDPVVGGAAASRVEVAVFDLSGRRVATLADGEQASGVHSVTWDGRDSAGRDVAAGVYFARLSWDGAPRATERVTIVR